VEIPTQIPILTLKPILTQTQILTLRPTKTPILTLTQIPIPTQTPTQMVVKNPQEPAPFIAHQTPMTTESESVFARQDSPKQLMDAPPEFLVVPTKSELLMEVVAAKPDLPTTMESALNVPPEPSGVPLPTNASLFVVKTQLTTKKLENVFVLKDSVFWVEIVKNAPETTS